MGAGLIFDDVYAALEPLDVNVFGGRVTGIGVAGFTLGGGSCDLVRTDVKHAILMRRFQDIRGRQTSMDSLSTMFWRFN